MSSNQISKSPTSSQSNISPPKPNALGVVHIPDSLPVGKQKLSAKPSLTPFERIKLETDRTTAHGHPLILPTDYGRHGPVFDVIALYHNAVKRQTIVAYNILEALSRFKYEVTHAETELFFEWFLIFQEAVITILSVEQQFVIPFLEQNGVVIPDLLNAAERQKARDHMSATLNEITKSLETIRLLAAGESIQRISSLVHAFLKLITDYFEIERVSLPSAIISANITEEKETQLRTIFIRALFTQSNSSICVPFLSHWLSRRQLRAWKKAHLGLFRTLCHNQWRRKVFSLYQEIPITILTKLTSGTASTKKATPTHYHGRKNRYKFR